MLYKTNDQLFMFFCSCFIFYKSLAFLCCLCSAKGSHPTTPNPVFQAWAFLSVLPNTKIKISLFLLSPNIEMWLFYSHTASMCKANLIISSQSTYSCNGLNILIFWDIYSFNMGSPQLGNAFIWSFSNF